MSSVDPRVRRLVRVSAALAAAGPPAEGEALGAALRAAREGDAREVEEVLVQSYLFLGYPAALNALARWRALIGPGPGVRSGSAEECDHRLRGERVCRTVYGGQYERLRENVRALHPDMERWMVEEGYGRVLGRPGLDLRTRELCIVAQLAVVGAARQLYSHARGALHAGATEAEVEGALELAGQVSTEPARRRAAGVWTRLLDRRRRDRAAGEEG
jgi:4-carboxymuconolactone decarboxylase